MAVTDPADVRLLAALAELGKVAVHELAARIGMDPREAAYRLVALSGSGLPLLVGVESDPQGLRAALAFRSPPAPYQAHPSGAVPAGHPGRPAAGPPPPAGFAPPGGAGVPGHPAPNPPSGPYPAPGAPQGVPSGPYPVPNGAHGMPSGPYAVPGAAQNAPSGPYAVPAPAHQQPGGPGGVPSGPHPAPAPDPVISTWGPPQTASWARGDQRPAPPPGPRTGRIGDRLASQGLEGEQLTVQLLEVQDPADFLFGAAGYRLEPGERAVVVHTEVTNTGPVPFVSLPDNYLELLTADGTAIAKAAVSLTSRPPHKIGVQPGETAGGHTVYVLAESTRVVSVRWSPRPEPDERSLTWSLED
ncbi:AsnC family protein [Amycolatopsis thermophila]|uniref:DNA-binding Lrp family transcriptional regulator n=1 Tax=Amycolatopsis thermophila TaxID=206084 RepID=A0ABU0F3Z1_9PSEU|nr:helix-turn-helix transcriptional regulator [Amycolatopsis thermophila]MDQ0382310.1 DNA-binding Lrp family transcriptional regulator [Amycolatopsis thermophila]